MSAPIEICTAAVFSAVMRRYSAGVQVPSAIIRLRRKTFSQDAIVSRAIIIGRVEDEFRARFLMSYEVSITRAATSGRFSLSGREPTGRALPADGRTPSASC